MQSMGRFIEDNGITFKTWNIKDGRYIRWKGFRWLTRVVGDELVMSYSAELDENVHAVKTATDIIVNEVKHRRVETATLETTIKSLVDDTKTDLEVVTSEISDLIAMVHNHRNEINRLCEIELEVPHIDRTVSLNIRKNAWLVPTKWMVKIMWVPTERATYFREEIHDVVHLKRIKIADVK